MIEISWATVLKFITAFLASVGTAGAIIFGLSTWLGKVWANRILQNEKHLHDQEIEKYKKDLDILKSKFLRYDEIQFKLYNELWVTLCEVKIAADALGNSPSQKTADNLTEKIRIARESSLKNELFINIEHNRQLDEILQKFNQLLFNYLRLLNIADTRTPEQGTIERILDQVEVLENAYSKLLGSLANSFREQLAKGTS